MAYDALTLSVLADEFRETLIGGKITKIYQPEKDEIVLFIFNGKTYKLVVSANAGVNRIHITDMPTDNPKVCPSFCMLLRKHVTNATITDVWQMPYERVVDFALLVNDDLGYRKEMHLVFELTGKTSNIILTDENHVTLDSIKHLPQDLDSTRIIMAGVKYNFFSTQDKIPPFDFARVGAYLQGCDLPLRKTLPTVLLGVSQATVNEMLHGINEDDHTTANNLRVLKQMEAYKTALSQKNPTVWLKNGMPTDVTPFEYHTLKGDKLHYPTLNKAHDEYYYMLDKRQRFNDKAKSVTTVIKNAISRTEKKLAAQRQCVLEAEQRETCKQYGDLILANIWQVKPQQAELVCDNYYDGTTAKIPLDVQLTAQQNAQAYYKKYRKLKSSAEHNTALVAENEKLLEYLLTIKDNLRYCTEEDDLAEVRRELVQLGLIKEKHNGKKQPAEKPVKPLHYRIDGFDVYVGKNNIQNNQVTFKTARPGDMWLHTQKVHSSHVVILSGGKAIPDDVIVKAAEICAYFSQASGGTKIAVDYTDRANVKKPPKAPLGFVIYPTYETILVDPNRHPELAE